MLIDALVDAVVDAQPNTVVVTFSPGAVLLPWSPKAKAILSMLMPGLEAGHAMADLLWGATNPSGRLPLTWPNVENEVGFTSRQYPGVNSTVSYYSEKLLVGYRWYTAHNVTPKFAFGHGKCAGQCILFCVCTEAPQWTHEHMNTMRAHPPYRFVILEFCVQRSAGPVRPPPL